MRCTVDQGGASRLGIDQYIRPCSLDWMPRYTAGGGTKQGSEGYRKSEKSAEEIGETWETLVFQILRIAIPIRVAAGGSKTPCRRTSTGGRFCAPALPRAL